MANKVFETLLVIDGNPVEEKGHVARLRDAIGMDITDFLREAAAELSGYYRLRIDFIPPESLTATPATIPMPSLFRGDVTSFQLVTKQLASERLNKGYGAYKIADRQELEALEAQTAPAIPLLIDNLGSILETARHNVFIIEEGSLVTPPLDGRILPGVTRQVILEEALTLGINSRQEPISLKRAQAASGMFLTNAIVGIGWVEQCNDTTWPEVPQVVQMLLKVLAHRWQPESESP